MNTTLRKLSVFSYTFVLMNLAAVAGLFHFMRGAAGSWDSDEYLLSRDTGAGAVDGQAFQNTTFAALPENLRDYQLYVDAGFPAATPKDMTVV